MDPKEKGARAEERAGEGGDELDLQINELEELTVPLKWACVCSTTCKCTSSSCAGWSFSGDA
jgi:hypothetical protein